MNKTKDDQALGIYVSIPFCASKCSYCNFASDVFASELVEPYIARLVAEIAGARAAAQEMGAEISQQVGSLYFGGGTPSLLDPKYFRQIASALRQGFELLPTAEWTVECAPGTVTPERLDSFLEAGVNRISFGVQSFVDKEARAVGRMHTPQQALDDIDWVRAAGIENISLDLMSGLPHQTAESWEHSLSTAISTGVPHLSVYMLEVDEGSRLGRELLVLGSRYHSAAVPTEEQIAVFYETACDRLGDAGWAQYEISNFAQLGAESQHNLRYWRRQPYVGFGLDAHSSLKSRSGEEILRWGNADDMNGYLAGQRPAPTVVGRIGQMEEALFLGLRMNRGVELAALTEEFGASAFRGQLNSVQELAEGGLLEEKNGWLRLTARGRMLSNEVFGRLLEATEPVSEEHAAELVAQA